MERWLSWSKAHDWKSCKDLNSFEGSNPSLSAKQMKHTDWCAFFVSRKGIRWERWVAPTGSFASTIQRIADFMSRFRLSARPTRSRGIPLSCPAVSDEGYPYKIERAHRLVCSFFFMKLISRLQADVLQHLCRGTARGGFPASASHHPSCPCRLPRRRRGSRRSAFCGRFSSPPPGDGSAPSPLEGA